MIKRFSPKLISLFVVSSISIFTLQAQVRDVVSLDGKWDFALDSVGSGDQIYSTSTSFDDWVVLPGTTDTNRKGSRNVNSTETTYLTRKYSYRGKAWYSKVVEIPKSWSSKRIELELERTKPSVVYVDGKRVGSSDNISTPQFYDLSSYLTPGVHRLTILVDNGDTVPEQLFASSHAYTESTQTNWNGIIGAIELTAKNKIYIDSLRVTPNLRAKSVSVEFVIEGAKNLKKTTPITISAVSWNSKTEHSVKSLIINAKKGESRYSVEYSLGEDALFWSEFEPNLYRVDVEIKGLDRTSENVGLREFKTVGTQFNINGTPTFLRGKHDACVFPLTAHTAMSMQEWREYFKTCKEYGINHVRFHSWCPPKGCFEAADIEGIYLQPELPIWGSLEHKNSELNRFLIKEGINIQNAYGNHASFVMFALGNELWGDLELMQEFVARFREVDNRHLYAYGSNNFLGYKGQLEGEQFMVTCRVGGAEMYETHTRGSFSFADAVEGGLVNNSYPNSVTNFDGAISKCSVPVVSHETGQFQIYPNYEEMKKYKGVLAPVNFEIFKQRLDDAGMSDQANAFFEASGKWSVELYKADIEMDLRTKGFGGFQLLDLQDYPGQGSAYVGILDAFMDNKGLVTPTQWREFCNDIVPLFVTEKFCYYNNEKLEGEIKIANYSGSSLKSKQVRWTLSDAQRVIESGISKINSDRIGLLSLGEISCSLSGETKAKKLRLTLQIDGSEYRNGYDIWVYPTSNREITMSDVVIVKDSLSQSLIWELEQGKTVLWFPSKNGLDSVTVGALFQTDYWNYRMFKNICDNAKLPVSPGTMGLLIDPKHPLFSEFPTDNHTSWQWYEIVKKSYPMILDSTPTTYRPVVQVIDNIERNHKLGLVYEFKVGNAKLLICMSDVDSQGKPEEAQFYKSLVDYVTSSKFEPNTSITANELQSLFTTSVKSAQIEKLINISYE